MNAQNKNRFASLYALQLSVFILAVLVAAQFAAAQQSSWTQQNADGTTSKVELLPGGGARVTTAAGDDVKDTVTNLPDSKYGQGGSKTTVQGKEGNNDVDIEVYRDAAGKVREVHYTNYGEKDKYGQKHEFNAKYDEKGQLKSYEKKINNKGGGDQAYPPSGGDKERIADEAAKHKLAAEEIIRARFGTDAPGGGAATNVEQPKMSQTEKSTPETPANNGGAKPSKTPEEERPKPSNSPNPRAPSFPSSQPTIEPSKIANYLTNIKEFPDLYTVQFTAPNKDILEVYLPRNMYPGGNLGSMRLIPSKAPDGGLSFKNDKLQIGDTNVPIAEHKFGCEFKPGESGKFRMVDSQGRSLGGVDFPTTDIKDAPATRDFPTSATYGQLIGLDFPPLPNPPLLIGNGPDPFEVKIGDQEMPIIAANRFGLVTREDYNRPGLTILQIKIGEKVITIPLRVLTLKLSAGSLLLSKYETTTVHIIAGGLEKLKAPAHMTIAASGVVKMTGATAVEIDPKMVAADGTYTTDRTLYAESAGTFGVDVTVTVDREPSDESKVTNPTTTSEKNDGGTDKKVSAADAEKRINAHFDYVRQRRARLAVDYSGDGARETLANAFKQSGVGYSMRFVDELAKNGLSQLWSNEGMPAYTHAYNLLDQISDVARKGGRIPESFMKSLDDEMERWKMADQAFTKQFGALVDLYAKQALISDERHAIEEKYTDQLEQLLKKENRQKGEIAALNRKQQEELKPVQERLEDTQKQIRQAETGMRMIADALDRFQPRDPDPLFRP